MWRNAINALCDYELERGLRITLAKGSGSPPTLGQFIRACKQADESGGAERNHSPRNLPAPEFTEPVWAHAQRCLLAFLAIRGAASELSLHAMIAEKNRLVQDFRAIMAVDNSLTGADIRDALFRAWDKLWQPMPEHEAKRHREHFWRTGFAAGFSDANQADAA